MVQVRVQRKGVDLNQAAKDFGVDVDRLKEDVLSRLAGEIAARSPVDSGTYAKSHEVGLRSGSFQANGVRPDGAPRNSKGDNVDINAARDVGFKLMLEDIQQLDIKSENFVFRNPMGYAPLIEAGISGDKTGVPPVYASAIREAPRIIDEVVRKIASRNR